MTYARYSAFLNFAALSLVLTVAAVGQSRPTVPGNSLESLRGATDPNAMNQEWHTALMAAAFDSDEKLLQHLIEGKANVNAASKTGMTALMYARGLTTVKLLLSAGASVNDKNLSGRTALHYATLRADPGVVQALIEAGADVNAKDDAGMSALQLANTLPLGECSFADESMRKAYKVRVQEVTHLLNASGGGLSKPEPLPPVCLHCDDCPPYWEVVPTLTIDLPKEIEPSTLVPR
jgi:hypothetical protein